MNNLHGIDIRKEIDIEVIVLSTHRCHDIPKQTNNGKDQRYPKEDGPFKSNWKLFKIEIPEQQVSQGKG